jgi:hypothetical protein
MVLSNILSRRNQKGLYYIKYLLRNIKNIDIYLFAYFPTVKSRFFQEWLSYALSDNCRLITLPSSFIILEQSRKYQGPKIFIFIGKELPLSCIERLLEKKVRFLLFNLKNKWYAFFVLFEIIKKKFHLESSIPKNFILNTYKVLQSLPLFYKY